MSTFDPEDDPDRAAGLLLGSDGRIFLALRSRICSHPGTWAIPGGSAHRREGLLDAAVRETREEFGSCPPFRVARTTTWSRGPFTFATFFALVHPEDARRWRPVLNEEHVDSGWFRPTALPSPIHPNLADVLGKFLGTGAA